jgi:hypothetical protein
LQYLAADVIESMYFGAGKMHRTGFINLFQAKNMHPSGAKAPFFPALDGMAKAMPLQSTIYETRSRSFASLRMTLRSRRRIRLF